tara:strand:- start:21750 stop:23825 length:2076 start_codon:yes stop_codon:yes gene_type:complete
MRFLLLVTFIICISSIYAQDFRKHTFEIQKTKTLKEFKSDSSFGEQVNNLEMPNPDGNSVKSYLLQQKIKSKNYFKNNRSNSQTEFLKSTLQPIIGDSLYPTRWVNGIEYPVYGGIPSDNTMAISNDGIVLLAMNSIIWAYDTNTDTTLFEDQQIGLRAFVDGFGTSFYYDPKLAYDPVEDRFVLALLKDNTPEKSEVIMCFSSTGNPLDPWYVYSLPGNPLDNNRWTDFPTISITNDKVYFTANLIIPNEPWQTGFDGSIIWEMDKFEAYSGDTSMQANLYDSITYDGNYVRNLHLITGANGNVDQQFLLSNRNFSIQNDTIFFLSIDNGAVSVSPIITDTPYGVPPNARQFDTDTSDATEGLQTNDARVLGGILIDDEIQFVANTVDPSTGFCGVYHGVVSNVYNSPSVTGRIIGDTVKDFGYPNIAWSGNEACDREVIIAFDHSSFVDFPGNSTIFCDNDRQYSPVLQIKAGGDYVNRLSGGYERWGDYYGLQRKYNSEGEVYSFGYLAMPNNGNSGFLAQLFSPDTSRVILNIDITSHEFCNVELTASQYGGESPFEYSWEGTDFSASNTFNGVCVNDTVTCVVRDNRGCTDTLNYVVQPKDINEGNVYPNPTTDQVAIQFELDNETTVYIEIYDDNGRLVKRLQTLAAKKGLNEYVFSMSPLAQGVYSVLLLSDEQVIQQEKIIKQ